MYNIFYCQLHKKVLMIKIVYEDGFTYSPEFFTFSGGEEYVSIANAPSSALQKKLTVYAQLTSSSEVMRLLMLANAINYKYSCLDTIDLFCPYLPYARQDRVCHPGQSFSLEVMIELLNKFSSITCADLHSNVATNIDQIPQSSIGVKGVYSRLGDVDYIVSPDKGAIDKSKLWLESWNKISKKTPSLIIASKKRDENGNIISTEIDCNSIKSRSSALIVDDICDGGRTFYELSHMLRKLGVEKVYLYVTHGILSKGIAATGCDKVFTTDSLPEKDDGRIIVKRFFNI